MVRISIKVVSSGGTQDSHLLTYQEPSKTTSPTTLFIYYLTGLMNPSCPVKPVIGCGGCWCNHSDGQPEDAAYDS